MKSSVCKCWFSFLRILRTDSVELAIGFIKECGQKLSQVSPRGLDQVFSTLRDLLHESALDKRTQYMIEVLFAVRKDQFKANPAIPADLDLVDENDQYTHMFGLDDPCEPEPMLGKHRSVSNSHRKSMFFSFADVFKFDENFEENEEKYKEIRKTILGEDSDDDDESGSGSSDTDEEGDGKNEDMDEDEKPAAESTSPNTSNSYNEKRSSCFSKGTNDHRSYRNESGRIASNNLSDNSIQCGSGRMCT